MHCSIDYYFLFYISSGFFFFKQKTAYEMRISDWSSDVCSSDLIAPPARARIACKVSMPSIAVGAPPEDSTRSTPSAIAASAAVTGSRDRKSVVQGKRVTARVDLSGGRIINKKQTLTTKNITTTYDQTA